MNRFLIMALAATGAICLAGCASGLVGTGGDSTPTGDDNRSFHDANDQANAAQAAAAAQNAQDATQAAANAAVVNQ